MLKMWPQIKKFLPIILCLIYSGLVTSLECEYYNVTECLGGKGPSVNGGGEWHNCERSRRTTTCTSEDPATHTVSCFVLWQRHNNNEILQFKGCFLNNKECVGMESCVDKKHGHGNKNGGGGGGSTPSNSTVRTHYCCCETDNCNKDFKWDPQPTTPTPKLVEAAPEKERSLMSILLWPIALGICGVGVGAAFLLHRKLNRKPPPSSQSPLTDEENILLDNSDTQMLSPVQLLEIKASGRFGSVWKATMAGHSDYVAVKILPMREKTSWRLEQEVYSLPLMCDSEFMVGYFGHRSDIDNMNLWLISEFIQMGSLYDYLKGHVLTWPEVLKVARTMCEGLAFLHEEIEAAKGVKPAVAHRDFKSKNVLLRPDLTACIADFGLAHIFYPTKPVGTNHGQVGTRRYMAPEVLDGAVSFTRDNFQRIDMYACGLVLWELASRTSAQQGPVGEYRLPFEEFVGVQPSLEEMMECVVSQRKRPTIRNDWQSHLGLAVLAEAMKDAWDQDAEARISASCIVERLNSINNKIIL